MEFTGDYHIHSRYSDGRDDIAGIVAAAKARGLQEIAITDHGPRVLVCGVRGLKWYRELSERIAAWQDDGIRVLCGAEANIIDLEGNLDLPPDAYRDLDVLICGLHPYTVPGSLADGYRLFARNHLRHLSRRSREKAIANNTRAVVAALEKNPVDILSHPGLFFQVDVEEVARACVRRNVKFEINCCHGYPSEKDVMIAHRIGVEFIVNSDAHHWRSVGNLEYGSRLLEKLGVPKERVYNAKGGGKVRWKCKRKN